MNPSGSLGARRGDGIRGRPRQANEGTSAFGSLRALTLGKRALLYAARELGRRAGLREELVRAARVEVLPSETLVFLPGSSRASLAFHRASDAHWRQCCSGRWRTLRASWPWKTPRGDDAPSDLVVPFVEDDAPAGPPFRLENGTLHCPIDLLGSALLVLGRFEELLPGPRDAWDRFPARAATLFRANALDRPVIDEWGLALREGLAALLPASAFAPPKARLFLSHDIDEIGIPFHLRRTLGHVARRRSPTAALQDVLAGVSRTSPALLAAVRTLVQASRHRGMSASVYLKASDRSPFDSGYPASHPKLLETTSWLRELGVELGVHPGHYTLGDPERLKLEVARLRKLLGLGRLGGRQHHLRWSPQSWLDWESAGLAYDSSVGFADEAGFRAGTCFPYRPWLLELDREASLLEVPLVVMDTTLLAYKKLDLAAVRANVAHLAARCRRVGGVFSLLWHNTNVIDPRLRELFERVLDDLSGWEAFDARAESERLG